MVTAAVFFLNAHPQSAEFFFPCPECKMICDLTGTRSLRDQRIFFGTCSVAGGFFLSINLEQQILIREWKQCQDRVCNSTRTGVFWRVVMLEDCSMGSLLVLSFVNRKIWKASRHFFHLPSSKFTIYRYLMIFIERFRGKPGWFSISFC